MNNDETIPYLERLYKSLLEDAEHVAKTIRLARARQMSITSGGEGPRVMEVLSNTNTQAPEPLVDIVPTKPSGYADYNNNSTYKAKLLYVLRVEQRFLTVKEISDIIHSLEPNLKYDTIKLAIGSTKSALVKDKKIAKYVVGPSHNNSFYGSNGWLDDEGNIKAEHMYDQNALYIPNQDHVDI